MKHPKTNNETEGIIAMPYFLYSEMVEIFKQNT